MNQNRKYATNRYYDAEAGNIRTVNGETVEIDHQLIIADLPPDISNDDMISVDNLGRLYKLPKSSLPGGNPFDQDLNTFNDVKFNKSDVGPAPSVPLVSDTSSQVKIIGVTGSSNPYPKTNLGGRLEIYNEDNPYPLLTFSSFNETDQALGFGIYGSTEHPWRKSDINYFKFQRFEGKLNLVCNRYGTPAGSDAIDNDVFIIDNTALNDPVFDIFSKIKWRFNGLSSGGKLLVKQSNEFINITDIEVNGNDITTTGNISVGTVDVPPEIPIDKVIIKSGGTNTLRSTSPANLFLQNLTPSSNVEFSTVDTGQGQNSLYPMDQDVLTTSNVKFNKITIPNTTQLNNNVNSQVEVNRAGIASITLNADSGQYPKLTLSDKYIPSIPDQETSFLTFGAYNQSDPIGTFTASDTNYIGWERKHGENRLIFFASKTPQTPGSPVNSFSNILIMSPELISFYADRLDIHSEIRWVNEDNHFLDGNVPVRQTDGYVKRTGVIIDASNNITTTGTISAITADVPPEIPIDKVIIKSGGTNTLMSTSPTNLFLQNLTPSSNVEFSTVDTGQGQNSLYPMNQDVLTTSNVTFNNIVLNGLPTSTDNTVLLTKAPGTNEVQQQDGPKYDYSFFENNIVSTTINTINVYERVVYAPITLQTGDSLFTITNDAGNLLYTYTGLTKKVNISINFNVHKEGGGASELYQFEVRVNGVKAGPSPKQKLEDNTKWQMLSVDGILILNPGDLITFWVRCETGTDNINVSGMTITAYQLI